MEILNIENLTFATLFVSLLMYVLTDTKKREDKLYQIIDNLTQKFEIINTKVDEILKKQE